MSRHLNPSLFSEMTGMKRLELSVCLSASPKGIDLELRLLSEDRRYGKKGRFAYCCYFGRHRKGSTVQHE